MGIPTRLGIVLEIERVGMKSTCFYSDCALKNEYLAGFEYSGMTANQDIRHSGPCLLDQLKRVAWTFVHYV